MEGAASLADSAFSRLSSTCSRQSFQASFLAKSSSPVVSSLGRPPSSRDPVLAEGAASDAEAFSGMRAS